MDLIIIGCLFYHTGYMLKRYSVLDRLYVAVTGIRQEYRGEGICAANNVLCRVLRVSGAGCRLAA